jgi:hypothetical protein
MYHCVYAAHVLPIEKRTQDAQVTDPITNEQVKEPVTIYNARILNNFGEIQSIDWTYPVEVSDGSTVPFVFRNVKLPGNLVVSTNLRNGGFEAGNNIRWLETKFQSTDPDDPNFLVPDWMIL